MAPWSAAISAAATFRKVTAKKLIKPYSTEMEAI